MATQYGETIALTAANMTPRGSGLILSFNALAALAFAQEPTGVPKKNGGKQFVVGILLASGSAATVSIARGYDALATPDPRHSAFRVEANGKPVAAGPYLRSDQPARDHYIVVKDAAPTGDQLQVTIGVG